VNAVPGEAVCAEHSVVATVDTVATGVAKVALVAKYIVMYVETLAWSVGAVAEKYTPKADTEFDATVVICIRHHFSYELLPAVIGLVVASPAELD
jgi:hypothetical protein